MAREIRGEGRPAEAVYVPHAEESAGAPDWQIEGLQRSRHVNHAAERAAESLADSDGFAFDTETLERLAEQWEGYRVRYYEALEDAEYLVNAEAPGLDYASVAYAEKVQASGEALKEALWERVRYCAAMRDKFLKALGKYDEAENDAESTVTQEKGKLE